MKREWFTHPEALDTETANELLSLYASRNIQARKTLSADPRLWLVQAYLECGNFPPRKDKTFEQPIWSR